MNNLTFCINTAKNERPYLELLFKSLYYNLSSTLYDIIVYIDSDNQDSYGFLTAQKEKFPNLKILRNPLPIPLGYQRNINLMFEMATTDIVSYIQSDMVILPNYDLEILKHISQDIILSATRIEPPLHPSSGEKITHNFGLDPQSFDFNIFNKKSVEFKQDKHTTYFFAPFTLYKKVWINIGGHDTLFRRSREDSDIAYRLLLSGNRFVQCWNALVYHFTCTSSRGIGWYTQAASFRTQLQQKADLIEMKRFIRKWGAFIHPHNVNDIKDNYKYNISINLKNLSDSYIKNCEWLYENYYFFNKIYIDDPIIRNKFRLNFSNEHSVANELLNITSTDWEIYKKYYNIIEPNSIFVDSAITTEDIIIDLDCSLVDLSNSIIPNIKEILYENRDEHSGEFECNGVHIIITNIKNVINDNIIVNNPSIDDLKIEFE